MARPRALEAVAQSVVDLLRDNYVPAEFNQDLEFRVYSSGDFVQHMSAGVSLFPYRVFVNGAHRIPAGRIAPSGERMRNRLPVDLHFVLTPWGKDASTQLAVAGWMMRTLEDTPILPPGLLNRRLPGVFDPDESVELFAGELPNEDLLHLWELLGASSYRLSIPYVARNVRIDSAWPLDEHALVQERVGHFQPGVPPQGAPA